MILSEATYTARKQHVCDWCITAIAPGERYYRQAYIDYEYGEGFQVWKAHAECDEAHRKSMERFDPDDIDWGTAHARGVAIEKSDWE